MSFPARIVVPVAGAVLTVGALLGFFFWQLEATRAFLMAQLSNAPAEQQSPTENIAEVSVAGVEGIALQELRTGDMHALRGEWSKAMESYQAAVDAEGGLPALRKLAQAQLQRRDIRGAQTTLDQLRRAGARSEDVLLLESIIHLRTGELAKAERLLESAEESPQKHYGMALLKIITADHEAAKQEITQVSNGWEPTLRSYARTLQQAYDEYALFPDSPAIHLQTLLARSLAHVQECELALPLLSAVTQTQDDYRDAWIVQGFCELTTERFPEALASLERAYQIDPEKPETQYFLARAYLGQGDHERAFTFLQYALRNGFAPESEVRRLLVQEAVALGNTDLALDHAAALTTLPDARLEHTIAYVSLALAAKRGEEAFVQALDATKKWPQDALAFDTLGWAAIATDRKEEAKRALEEALRLNPHLQSAAERLRDL